MYDNYLLSNYQKLIIEILSDCDENKHFSVNIDFVELSGNDPNLGNSFLAQPENSLEQWDQALLNVQTNLIQQSEENYLFKKHAKCRIFGLPLYPELHRIKFPQNDDYDKFLQVSGTVFRITAVKMFEYQRQYVCAKCKNLMTVNAQYHLKNIIKPPKKCQNPEGCQGTTILSMGELNAEFCKDYQEVKIQETVSKLDVGSVPKSMWVTLEDDLVDTCKPGDNVTVCGFVKLRHEPFMVGKEMEMELVLKANHVHVNNNSTSILSLTAEHREMFQAFWKTYNDTPLAARDMILKSICPEIFGLFIVKLATAVVLAGGSNLHNNSDTGVRVRTEPHMLLVGDPGTGKSQLLRFASKIIPRSVLTTGVGSTAAGLTVTAVMENGEWQLEGGALVMSDGGICCIDEFNTMKEHDRMSIHEAMEQQTISVAKAGIVCKLSTRCSILAATNPKGNLDRFQPLTMNVALPSPLLSRFDLVLLLKDKVDEEWDSHLADYILNSSDCNSSKFSDSVNWTIETLQAYFAVIKKIHPVLTEDSNKILSGYYQAQRRKSYRNKARTTVRLLDSLVRLSQGHARLMFHEEVSIMDAVIAVILVETAMEPESSVFNLSFNLREDFPQNAKQNYLELAEVVLKKLDLNDLLQKEHHPQRKSQPRDNTPKVKTEKPREKEVDKERFDGEKTEQTPEESELNQARFPRGQNEETNDRFGCGSSKAQKQIADPPKNRSRSKSFQEKTCDKSANAPVLPGPSCRLLQDENTRFSSCQNEETVEAGKRLSCGSSKVLNQVPDTPKNQPLSKSPGQETCIKSASVPVLSQRTKIRNKLCKFRFISKENEEPGAKIEDSNKITHSEDASTIARNIEVPKPVKQNIEPTDNIFENEDDICDISLVPRKSEEELVQHTRPLEFFEDEEISDISFANVVTSTQTSVKKVFEEPKMEEKLPKKKFNFKKLVAPDKPATSKAPASIFESHEDIDNMDWDL